MVNSFRDLWFSSFTGFWCCLEHKRELYFTRTIIWKYKLATLTCFQLKAVTNNSLCIWVNPFAIIRYGTDNVESCYTLHYHIRICHKITFHFLPSCCLLLPLASRNQYLPVGRYLEMTIVNSWCHKQPHFSVVLSIKPLHVLLEQDLEVGCLQWQKIISYPAALT